jgi:hypothetical protein
MLLLDFQLLRALHGKGDFVLWLAEWGHIEDIRRRLGMVACAYNPRTFGESWPEVNQSKSVRPYSEKTTKSRRTVGMA